MKDLLLVIDMQNIYREGAPWGCRNTAAVVRNILSLLDSAAVSPGGPEQVIFTRFDAPASPRGCWQIYNKEYELFNHDVYLNDIMAELKPYTDIYPVYSKSTYSSYSVPEIQDAVRNADRVLLTGVVAECCILATLESLIDTGVKVLYVKDAIAGQTAAWETTVRDIAESFSSIHTEIITAAEYVSR